MIRASGGVVVVWRDVGRFRPDELVGGDTLARVGHARDAEIRAVGENGGQQGVLVVVRLASLHVSEGEGKAGRASDLMEQLSNADARHQPVDPRGERLGGDGLLGADGRDRQLTIFQRHAFNPTLREAMREAFQPPVKFAAAIGQPLVGGRGQLQASGDRRGFDGGQQIAVELAVVGRAFDPDIAGAPLVAQVRHDASLPQSAIGLVAALLE